MFTVKRVERKQTGGRAASLVFGFDSQPPREGWFAEIEDGLGSKVLYSKLDGETDWTLDANFSAKGVPITVTGFGTRGVVKGHATADIAAELDRHTRGG